MREGVSQISEANQSTHHDHLVDSLCVRFSMPGMSDTRNWLASVEDTRQRRLPRLMRDGTRIQLDGIAMVDFSSNDYLGLSHHPDVLDAAHQGLKYGLGSGASRLISGDNDALHQLEHALTDWLGFEAALIVGSGMLANIGLLQALSNRHAHLFTDRLNHASLIDGARLGGGKVHRYRHGDMDELDNLLRLQLAERRIIVSDGVFSMDGDTANVAKLVELAEVHDAILVIDDAHGIGTMGPGGQGLVAKAGLSGHPRLVCVGTFGKAFGSYGAFILGTRELIDGLIQRLRTIIYSTALPPLIPQASLAALRIIQEKPLVQQLHSRIAYFREQSPSLSLLASDTPIQPLMIGEETDALQVSKRLAEAGYFVPAIRPPTVPEGTARLRITLSAAHDEIEISELIKALEKALT